MKAKALIWAALFCPWTWTSTLAETSGGATVRGVVLDLQTHEPIAKARVYLPDHRVQTVTDDLGRFEIREVEAPDVEVCVTTVGYGLLRKRVALPSSGEVELEFLLGQDTLKRTDAVTVSTSVFEDVQIASAGEHSLNNTELRNLANVLLDDPLRSVQTLPGVAAGDDLRAQFAVRGSGFSRTGLYIDGALLRAPFHTVQDIHNDGSLALFNGDVIEAVTLISGAVPPQYGDRTAAALNIVTREGASERTFFRGGLSGSGVSFTGEGPVGKAKRATWLASARKSYLDWLIRRLSDDPDTAPAFGFVDFQGKLSWNPGPGHQLRFLALLGRAEADEERRRESLGLNSMLTADNDVSVVNGSWQWAPASSTLLQTAASYSGESGLNLNRYGQQLYEGDYHQVACRQDLVQQVARRHRVEGGISVRWLRESAEQHRFDAEAGQFRKRVSFREYAWQPGAYVQGNWNLLSSRITLSAGGRFDRSTLLGQNVWLPRFGIAVMLSSRTHMRAAYGRHAQFPDFQELRGIYGNPALRAERSEHALLSVEHRLTDKLRFRLEGYEQQETGQYFAPGSEYRMENGRLVRPSPDARLGNLQASYSRGLEIFLQRRSANGLSGWISYSYGHARARVDALGLHFDKDYDQRHTLNVYGSCRLTDSLNLSTKFRYGSNFPIAGFYELRDGRYFLSDERNGERAPYYSRMDIRVSKAFVFDRWKLTLYVEVFNLLGRENHRYTGLNSVRPGGEARLAHDTMLPFLPFAGLTFEF